MDLIKEMGHDPRNAIIMTNGNILELDSYSAKVTGYVDVDPVLVDGLGVGDVGSVVLRDRKILSEDGLMIVVIGVEKRSGQVVAGPDIVSRGFVYVKESEELMENCRMVVRQVLAEKGALHMMDWNTVKSDIREALRGYLWREIKRNPMILPIIMEVKG